MSLTARNGRIAGLTVMSMAIGEYLVLTQSSENWFPSILSPRSRSQCAYFPDPGNLAIAVKTGATEAVARIPTRMLTTLLCSQSVMIFSDLEQDILGYHLHDALESIPESTMASNSDFDFYKKLKDAQKLGQIEVMLATLHDPRTESDLASWTLDKYKQLHILEKLYGEYPDKEWYVMIDADTYLVWPNLLRWLRGLPDPKSTARYLGSPANVGDFKFGHGGSGIILSHAALSALASKNAAATWDEPMHDKCCGDYIIGTVLEELNISLQASWPTINGEKPITLPFGESHWCQPIVSMHHVSPAEMSQLSNFERLRDNTHPLTFADLYGRFIKDVLPVSLEEWDSMSHGQVVELDSYVACEEACLNKENCFQFVYSNNECGLGHEIRLGKPKASKDGKSWHSGWLRDRINVWTERQGACDPAFPWT